MLIRPLIPPVIMINNFQFKLLRNIIDELSELCDMYL